MKSRLNQTKQAASILATVLAPPLNQIARESSSFSYPDYRTPLDQMQPPIWTKGALSVFCCGAMRKSFGSVDAWSSEAMGDDSLNHRPMVR